MLMTLLSRLFLLIIRSPLINCSTTKKAVETENYEQASLLMDKIEKLMSSRRKNRGKSGEIQERIEVIRRAAL